MIGRPLDGLDEVGVACEEVVELESRSDVECGDESGRTDDHHDRQRDHPPLGKAGDESAGRTEPVGGTGNGRAQRPLVGAGLVVAALGQGSRDRNDQHEQSDESGGADCRHDRGEGDHEAGEHCNHDLTKCVERTRPTQTRVWPDVGLDGHQGSAGRSGRE